MIYDWKAQIEEENETFDVEETSQLVFNYCQRLLQSIPKNMLYRKHLVLLKEIYRRRLGHFIQLASKQNHLLSSNIQISASEAQKIPLMERSLREELELISLQNQNDVDMINFVNESLSLLKECRRENVFLFGLGELQF